MAGPLAVRGYTDFQRALARADRDTRLGVRKAERELVRPVQQTAEQLSLSEIRNMPSSPQWARMRIGITRRAVYIAPRQKGTRGRGRGRRPNLADLMMDRAMEPALTRNIGRIEAGFERMIDQLCDRFNGGALI